MSDTIPTPATDEYEKLCADCGHLKGFHHRDALHACLDRGNPLKRDPTVCPCMGFVEQAQHIAA